MSINNFGRAFVALSLCLLAIGCGRGSASEPVEEATAAPVDAPASTPTWTPAPPPSDAESPLDVESPLEPPLEPPTTTDVVTDAALSTNTEALTTNESLTPTDAITESTAAASESTSQTCAIQPALDFAGYPDLIETLGCPQSEGAFEPVALNEFRGPEDRADETLRNPFMLWFGTEQRIYALLPNGEYQLFDDTWNEEVEDEYLCNPLGGDVDSPPLPRRGFGKVWCDSEQLQEVLGPVVREERLCQHAVTQEFQAGRLLACFEDASVYYFQLTEAGQWNLQVQ